jgi:hypothetical protein
VSEAARGEADEPLGPRQRIELWAHLLPARHLVRGRERVTFRNTSDVALTALTFHLYANAFEGPHTVLMQESRGRARGRSAGRPGHIELQSLWVDGRDVLAKANDRLVEGDRTQLEVPLPEPLSPGASCLVELTFDTHLPDLFVRMGDTRDFFAVAQWFPKLAKLESDGHFESFPYHALSEFYADFADYQVEIKADRRLSVFASGTLREEHKLGNEVVRTFVAERVHDVAFVAGGALTARREVVDGIECIFVVAEGYDLPLPVIIQTVRQGLRYFASRYGPYAYETLTVVLPPRRAAGAAGMEYPTIFLTDGSHWPPPWFLHGGTHAFVTAHELAHQWFQGMIASNEQRYPVLDEGLSEWAAIDLLRHLHGEAASVSEVGPVSRFELERLFALGFSPSSMPARFPAEAYTPVEYGRTIYGRAAIALETVRRTHGRERFERALSSYARAQRFRHPTPDDLGAAFDLAYGPGFAERVVFPLVFDGESTSVWLTDASSRRDDEGYVTRVRARRAGVSLPTWVAFYDVEGVELSRVRFPTDHDRLELAVHTPVRVARVVADPDRALLVDPQARDQIVTFEQPRSLGITARVITALQWLLSLVAP